MAFPVDTPCNYVDSWQADRGTDANGTALYHEGVDIIAASGIPIRAVSDGTVTRMSSSARGGIQLYLTLPDGTYYFHAHLSRYADGLVVGQRVTAGQIIAYVGQTGDAQFSVPHLHFEVHPAWNAKKPVNPYPIVRALGGCGKAAVTVSTTPGSTAAVPPSTTTPGPTGELSNGFDGLSTVAPDRLADSRSRSWLTRLTPFTVNSLTIAGRGDVPSNARAVALNLTVTNATTEGWLRSWPCGVTIPATSTANFGVGKNVANSVIVGIGQRGRVCFQASAGVDLIVDVTARAGNGGQAGFVGQVPSRLVDTRTTGAMVEVGTTLRVPIGSDSSVGASVNITAVEPTGAGFLTAWACDQSRPSVSSLNFSAGENTANSATIGVGVAGEICLSTSIATHVLVDLSGKWVVRSGLRPTTIMPVRLVDTRTSRQRLAPGVAFPVVVSGTDAAPRTASGVLVNVTVTQPAIEGFATVWPCNQPQPNVSNLNFLANQTVSNSATIQLGDGKICVATSTSAHIIVDATGYLS